MTRKADLFILDTNILVHLIRDSSIGRWVTQHFDLRNQPFRQLISVVTAVLHAYAEIDFHLQKSGRAVEQNDMWIAATASAANAHLLTTDRDFDPLDPHFLTRTWIDPDLFRAPG